ncbi:MAG: ribosome biogenesis GTPase Der [Flavobacteriales bacterium]|nr:ribosome biogenesis GTPase Der [Flavobacteriales bacterium]|tara:strand:+ start:755 stop:2059 length:1305 start_codon:yes stop_codon:yes gene_type:complete
MSNIVVIVGRPNVGKSTLFNRLIQRKQAIVDDESGVTRDRHYARTDWNGVKFSLVDTGGYTQSSSDTFEKEIKRHVNSAIEESSLILFIVDVKSGITDLDFFISQMLKKESKKVLLVVNKVDDGLHLSDAAVFYKLGFGDYFPISSISGSGTGDLLDSVVTYLDPEEKDIQNEVPKISVSGRPNVGKSSLINALLGEEKNIVTDIPGTTRDSIDSRYKKFGHDFDIIDTAGIRKKNKVNEDIEYYSVLRSIRSIENADVVLLLIDATRGFEAQDQKIFDLIQKNKKGVVLVVNKWDLIDKNTITSTVFAEKIKEKIAPFVDVSLVFISVKDKLRILKVVEEAMNVYNRISFRISTGELNRYLLDLIERTPPPSTKGKYVKIKYITQLPTKKPTFVFFCNLPQYVKESYKRFLENKIREKYCFTGVPVQLFFRKK